jgi:hypothetical protein
LEQPHPEVFSSKRTAPGFGPAEAIEAARRTMAATGHPAIDGVAACELGEDGLWRVEVEVVESRARMGDNDLLAAYDVRLGEAGEVRGFRRLRRYFREDGPAA